MRETEVSCTRVGKRFRRIYNCQVIKAINGARQRGEKVVAQRVRRDRVLFYLISHR